MLNLDDQPCPVCQHRGSSLFHQTTYPEQSYHGNFALRRCDSCGLLFNSPRLDNEGLGHLYGRNYYFFLRKDDREFARIVAMYQRTVGLIADKIPTKESVDIGCGRGYFPAVLKALGWNAQGIEISPDAGEYGRSTFGLEVFTGTVEQYASSPQRRQFPLVTGIDVIEHVPDPVAFVAASASLVAPGGYLIIDTPNARAKNIDLKGLAWKGFNPFHIYLFGIDHLTRMLEKEGLQVEMSFSYGNTQTPRDANDAAIATLKKAHLLGPMVSAYFAMKKLTIGKQNPAPFVAQAAERIKNEPPFTATADNSAALATSKTGDNIVVIARKP